MVDNDNRHCGVQAAFDAVEARMLPGLGDAAEEAGPEVLLALNSRWSIYGSRAAFRSTRFGR
jgi:hypothetical protein